MAKLLFHGMFWRITQHHCASDSRRRKEHRDKHGFVIVIAAYNEESGIPLVVAELRRVLGNYAGSRRKSLSWMTARPMRRRGRRPRQVRG